MRPSPALAVAVLAAALAACDAPMPAEPAAFRAEPSFQADNGKKPVTTTTRVRYETSFTSWSPCTREPIEVSGTYHLTMTATVTDDEIRLRSHMNTQGVSGRGVYSGRLYQFISTAPNDHSEQETVFPNWGDNRYEAAASLSWRVISQGDAGDFYSTMSYTIVYDPENPEASGMVYRKFDSGCRG